LEKNKIRWYPREEGLEIKPKGKKKENSLERIKKNPRPPLPSPPFGLPTDGPRFHPLGPCLQLAEPQSRGEGVRQVQTVIIMKAKLGGGGGGGDTFSLVQFHHCLPEAVVLCVIFFFVAGRCGNGDTSRCFFLAREKQTQRSTEIQRDRDVDEREREREREREEI
jgi:hypothetical protein